MVHSTRASAGRTAREPAARAGRWREGRARGRARRRCPRLARALPRSGGVAGDIAGNRTARESVVKNLSIGVRLTLAFAAMVVIALAVAGAGDWGVQAMSRSTQQMIAGDLQRSRLAAAAYDGFKSVRRF